MTSHNTITNNCYKNIIIDALEKLKNIERTNNQPFKVRAYSKVIDQINDISYPISSIDDLKSVSGIGDKIKQKLMEIFDTGNIRQLNEYESQNSTMKNDIDAFNIFTNVYGIGPTKARELVHQHNINSIQKLREIQDIVLNDVQKKGLKYYEDFLERIDRSEMIEHESYICNVISLFNKKLKLKTLTCTLMGSFRRGELNSGDIDVLITGCNGEVFQEIIEYMILNGYITDTFAYGPKKVLAAAKLHDEHKHRRIDFLLTSQKEYPFALLYFTGSGPFNIAMRNVALSKGYSMNEHGMKVIESDEVVCHEFRTEKDIFVFLGMKYVPPDKRISHVSIEFI